MDLFLTDQDAVGGQTPVAATQLGGDSRTGQNS
jgi:hypothetical protein